MTTHLIELSLGPVQGFIAAARRSRDLWAGSHLLSECARAAGKALKEGGAALIYPVEDRVFNANDEENSNLSNVLLARLEGDSDAAQALAERAIAVARGYLQETAKRALRDWQETGVQLREDLWARQVDDALEAFSAWCVVEDDYRRAYDSTKAALGARKNTRNFAPMFEPGKDLGFGIPKSSLDGVRESVLPRNRKRFPPRFGVAPGEQLDALGCIKRVVGRGERFTALTRLAADGWLQALSTDDPEALARLRDAYAPLVGEGYATRTEGNAGCYRDFPFDAGLLYPERLDAAINEAREDGAPEALHALDALRGTLRPLWKAHGQPCPYAAIVVADGDRMGRFIDKANTAEQHSDVSRAIAKFADKVPAIAREHRGHCIFNGGEDLLVLFPLAGVVEGGRALSAAFDAAMADVVRTLLGDRPDPDDLPTLRVGAAICHVQEPLGLIRQYGDAAEKFAKGQAGSNRQGNALGIQLYVRAGHVVPWRARFDAPEDFTRLQAWCSRYADGSLPGKLAYAIRQAWLTGLAQGLDAEIVSLEVKRAIEHASQRGGADGIDASVVAQLLERGKRWQTESDPTGYGALVDELVLARWLSARSSKDLGREDA